MSTAFIPEFAHKGRWSIHFQFKTPIKNKASFQSLTYNIPINCPRLNKQRVKILFGLKVNNLKRNETSKYEVLSLEIASKCPVHHLLSVETRKTACITNEVRILIMLHHAVQLLACWYHFFCSMFQIHVRSIRKSKAELLDSQRRVEKMTDIPFVRVRRLTNP